MREGGYHVVECLYGASLHYFSEVMVANAHHDAVLRDLAAGQYADPMRVIAFDVESGRARDVSGEIAADLAILAVRTHATLPASIREFCERHGCPITPAA